MRRTAFDVWMEFAAKVGKQFGPSYVNYSVTVNLSLRLAVLVMHGHSGPPPKNSKKLLQVSQLGMD